MIPVSRIMRHADDDNNINSNDNTNENHYYTCFGVLVRTIQRKFLKMTFLCDTRNF